eukprot:jgi/Tetstr1/426088/TSEL_016419.t1
MTLPPATTPSHGSFVLLCPPKSVDFGEDGHVVRGDPRDRLQHELELLLEDGAGAGEARTRTEYKYAHLPGGALARAPGALPRDEHSHASENGVMTVFRGHLENYAYLVKKFCSDDEDCKAVAWKGLNEIKAAAPVSAAQLLCRMYCSIGKEMPAKLRGQFSLVCYDSHLVRVLAVRDPSGAVPLVHGRCPSGTLVVASGASLPADVSEVRAMPPGYYKYGWYSKPLKYANELQTVQRGATDATSAALKALAGIRKPAAGKSTKPKRKVVAAVKPAPKPIEAAPAKAVAGVEEPKATAQSDVTPVLTLPALSIQSSNMPRSLLEALAGPMEADAPQSQLLTTMLDTKSTAVVITDARKEDQPIVYANPIFELTSGYSQEEVLGKNCRFLQAPPGKPRVPTFTSMSLKRKIQNGMPMNVRLLNYHKDGSPMWNDLSLLPLRDSSGEVTHFVGLQTFRPIGAVSAAGCSPGTPMCSSPRGVAQPEPLPTSPALSRVTSGFPRSISCNTLGLLNNPAAKSGSHGDLLGLALSHGVVS